MNDKQENFRSMVIAVQKVCIDYQSIWQGNAVFANNFNILGVLIGDLNAARLRQEQHTGGIATDKEARRKELVKEMLSHISGIKSYAADTNNNELYESVNYSKTQLLQARDTMLTDKGKQVRDVANAQLSNLGGYGINAGTVVSLSQRISDFEGVVGSTGAARSKKGQATASIKELIGKMRLHLKRKMDNNIEVFKDTHPEFYGAYHHARKIVDTAGKTGLKGRVTDKQTKAGIGGAVAVLRGVVGSGFRKRADASAEDVREARTNRKGNFSFKRVPSGSYQLEVSKGGYKRAVVNVTVEEGKMNDADVEMEKEV